MIEDTISTVLVVGGSGVIGQAICTQFAQHHWKVGIHFRSQAQRAQKIASSLTQRGGRAHPFQADITQQDQVEKLFLDVKKTFHRLDVLVYSAGSALNGLALKFTPAQWDSVLNTNLTGAFHCLKSAGQIFHRQHGGSVILIGSLSALHGRSGLSAYTASKAGLIGLLKSTALEWGPANIRINAIFPGWHQSPLSENGFEDKNLQNHVLQRHPELQDVSHLTYHLATSQSISGQIFNLDNRIA